MKCCTNYISSFFRDEELPLHEEFLEGPGETQPIHHITLLFFLVASIFIVSSHFFIIFVLGMVENK